LYFFDAFTSSGFISCLLLILFRIKNLVDMTALMADAVLVDQRAPSALPPLALISWARAFTASRFLAVQYTFAPCAAKDRATAPAMSPDAVNTTATLSFNICIWLVFVFDEQAGSDG
jgi:hypothetical protein